MSGDDAGTALFYALLLLLPLSALVARKIAWRHGLAMAAGWIAIFGVILVAATQRDRLTAIGRDLSHAFDPEAGERAGETLRVPMAADGHFWIRANVNGNPVRFLIDSGATTTALGAAAAQAAGVEPDDGIVSGIGVPISTANGTVIAHRATIGTLDIGGIVRSGQRVLVAPEFGETNVLGMDFLSSLDRWGVERRTLVLVP